MPAEMRQVAIALLKAYAKQDETMIKDPEENDDVERWAHNAVLLTASAAVSAKEELSNVDPGKEWGHMIINRIIRGVLWTIRNGNAPGWDPLAKVEDRGADRSLECSLSSKWLEQKDTVYIS